MLYPFVEHTSAEGGDSFEKARDSFSVTLQGITPFKAIFSAESFHYFPHKKFCTLWLKPLLPGYHKELEGAQDIRTRETVIHGSDVKPSEEAAEALEMPQMDESSGINADLGMHAFGGDFVRKTKQEKKLEKTQRKKAQAASMDYGAPHSDVIQLQSVLLSCYPECNDVNVISERGFMPHLSLGQFPHKEVESYMDEFKRRWNNIEFDVTDVHLISRADFHDPFHVRHSISFGKSDQHT